MKKTMIAIVVCCFMIVLAFVIGQGPREAGASITTQPVAWQPWELVAMRSYFGPTQSLRSDSDPWMYTEEEAMAQYDPYFDVVSDEVTGHDEWEHEHNHRMRVTSRPADRWDSDDDDDSDTAAQQEWDLFDLLRGILQAVQF